jgi:hypothetical protein
MGQLFSSYSNYAPLQQQQGQQVEVQSNTSSIVAAPVEPTWTEKAAALPHPHSAVAAKLTKPVYHKFIVECVAKKCFSILPNDMVVYYENTPHFSYNKYLLRTTTGGGVSSGLHDDNEVSIAEKRAAYYIIQMLYRTNKSDTHRHLLTFDVVMQLFIYDKHTAKRIIAAFGEPALFWKDLLQIHPTPPPIIVETSSITVAAETSSVTATSQSNENGNNE